MGILIRKVKFVWIGLVVVGLSLAAYVFSMAMFAAPAGAAPAAAPVDQLVGFGVGTTGGQGGQTVTVSSLSALQNAVSGSTPRIVKVSGTINGSGGVTVGSNKSILGVGSSATLSGVGLDMKGVSNVIIRNLTIHNVTAASGTGDAVHIEKATHIWVDHNNLYSDLNHGKDYYDGLVDITHAGDFVTVSWNRIHNHFKVSLVGHVDTNGSEDKGHLRVTYHHNWFYNVSSRTPSMRFGTGHVYDNYFQNISTSGIHSRMGAQMLIENNVFRGVATPVTTTGDSSQDGFANVNGNDWGGGKPNITKTGSFTTPPYGYTLDATSSVINIVTASSGVGIVG